MRGFRAPAHSTLEVFELQRIQRLNPMDLATNSRLTPGDGERKIVEETAASHPPKLIVLS